MPDLTTELRRAVISTLKNDAALTAIVPAGSIYTGVVPSGPGWPFLRWGVPITAPREATCLRGEEIDFTLHSFASPRLNGGGQAIETGEDHIGRIDAAVKASLHRARLTTPSGHVAIRWLGNQRMIDGNAADEWHGVNRFRARVMAP